jgi:putative ABC transport system permease protein
VFENYVKIALRNLARSKAYSVINIFGLAVGMASSFLIFLWVQDELSFDRFHNNVQNIYQVTYDDGSVDPPFPLAGVLKSELPEIVTSTNYIYTADFMISHGENRFYESGGMMASPSFLEFFTFPLIAGDSSTALHDPFSIVITESMAKKYFGTENPIGKTITFESYENGNYTVTGVIKDHPKNSYINFNYIRSINWLANLGVDMTKWDGAMHTFVQVTPNADLQAVNKKITDIVHKYVPEEHRTLFLQPMTQIHLYKFGGGGPITYVYIFSAIALFVLLIACINFITLSTARSTFRAKEVGMRKIVGASKADLIKQFFAESTLMIVIALILAWLLVEIFLPVFNNLSGKTVDWGSAFDAGTLLGIVAIAVVAGLLAGSYPALFLSSFQPAPILKGTLRSGPKGSFFRKVLVVTQFTLSIFLIIGTISVRNQIVFMQNKDLGFKKEHIIYLSFPDNLITKDMWSTYKESVISLKESIKNELLKSTNILEVTAFSTPPDMGTRVYQKDEDVHWEGQQADQHLALVIFNVNHDYLDFFGMSMAQGRFFSKDMSTDEDNACVVNETAVKAMGMDSPIGKKLAVYGDTATIVGVIKDFNLRPLQYKIEPIVMRMTPEYCSFFALRIKPDNIPATLHFLENKWKGYRPGYPFEYSFLDERLNRSYRSEQRAGTILEYFTVLAIFISCLGLLGLSSYMAEQRTKEIGVRKVLGASVTNIVGLMSRDFIILVCIANVIAWPLAYYAVNKWLQGFAYHIDIRWTVFALAAFLTIIIAFATMSFQTIRAAIANPVDSLRYE